MSVISGAGRCCGALANRSGSRSSASSIERHQTGTGPTPAKQARSGRQPFERSPRACRLLLRTSLPPPRSRHITRPIGAGGGRNIQTEAHKSIVTAFMRPQHHLMRAQRNGRCVAHAVLWRISIHGTACAQDLRPEDRRWPCPMLPGTELRHTFDDLQRGQTRSPNPSLQNTFLQHRQPRSAAISPRALAGIGSVSTSLVIVASPLAFRGAPCRSWRALSVSGFWDRLPLSSPRIFQAGLRPSPLPRSKSGQVEPKVRRQCRNLKLLDAQQAPNPGSRPGDASRFLSCLQRFGGHQDQWVVRSSVRTSHRNRRKSGFHSPVPGRDGPRDDDLSPSISSFATCFGSCGAVE